MMQDFNPDRRCPVHWTTISRRVREHLVVLRINSSNLLAHQELRSIFWGRGTRTACTTVCAGTQVPINEWLRARDRCATLASSLHNALICTMVDAQPPLPDSVLLFS